jgi:hypothetical protein
MAITILFCAIMLLLTIWSIYGVSLVYATAKAYIPKFEAAHLEIEAAKAAMKPLTEDLGLVDTFRTEIFDTPQARRLRAAEEALEKLRLEWRMGILMASLASLAAAAFEYVGIALCISAGAGPIFIAWFFINIAFGIFAYAYGKRRTAGMLDEHERLAEPDMSWFTPTLTRCWAMVELGVYGGMFYHAAMIISNR